MIFAIGLIFRNDEVFLTVWVGFDVEKIGATATVYQRTFELGIIIFHAICKLWLCVRILVTPQM